MAAHRRRHATPQLSRTDFDRLAAAVDPHVAEPALVVGIAVTASRDWKAAAWLLERRFPQRWGAGRVAVDEDD
jgi:hypothetical protein